MFCTPLHLQLYPSKHGNHSQIKAEGKNIAAESMPATTKQPPHGFPLFPRPRILQETILRAGSCDTYCTVQVTVAECNYGAFLHIGFTMFCVLWHSYKNTELILAFRAKDESKEASISERKKALYFFIDTQPTPKGAQVATVQLSNHLPPPIPLFNK